MRRGKGYSSDLDLAKAGGMLSDVSTEMSTPTCTCMYIYMFPSSWEVKYIQYTCDFPASTTHHLTPRRQHVQACEWLVGSCWVGSLSAAGRKRRCLGAQLSLVAGLRPPWGVHVQCVCIAGAWGFAVCLCRPGLLCKSSLASYHGACSIVWRFVGT